MMEYERFTKIRPIEEWVLDCSKCENQDKCSELGAAEENYHYCINRIGKRLAELEDKIEQGTIIELPCKVGDTVYVIASCNDVDMYRIYEENRCECPFEYDCDYEDCDAKGTTLRVFDTKVTGIYGTVGYKGFFVEFEYLNVQYQLEDFGEKFFLTREEAEKRLKELQE
jgi:hypothetical protein